MLTSRLKYTVLERGPDMNLQALSLLKDDFERANLRMAKKDRDIQVCSLPFPTTPFFPDIQYIVSPKSTDVSALFCLVHVATGPQVQGAGEQGGRARGQGLPDLGRRTTGRQVRSILIYDSVSGPLLSEFEAGACLMPGHECPLFSSRLRWPVVLVRWEDFAPVLTEILDLKKEVAQVRRTFIYIVDVFVRF